MSIKRVISQYRLEGLLAAGTLLLQLGVIAIVTHLPELEHSDSTRVASLSLPNQQPALPVIKAVRRSTHSESAVTPAAIVAEQAPVVRGESTSVYRILRGESLSTIWEKNGGSYNGAITAARALKEAGESARSLRAGEEVEIGHHEDGDIALFRRKLPAGKIVELRGNSLDGYSVETHSQKIIETERRISATIDYSIFDSASELSVPYGVIDELVDLFGTRIEFRRDMRKGDQFSLLFTERKTEQGELLPPGPIKAASIHNRGEMLAAVRHVGKDGVARYYDETGDPLGNYFLRYPVRFSRISSSFSRSRFHPVLKRRRPHNGVDFAAATGTSVRSVADGVIVSAGYNGGAGKMVKIRHGSRYQTAYLHLSKISSGIRKGARVTRGQVIGKVGMTGLATGPHLHYSLYDRGRYVDPMQVKLPRMPQKHDPIPMEYLKATLRILQEVDSSTEMADASVSQQKRRRNA